MNHPILQFDFESQPVIFSQPNDVIQTDKLNDIQRCLQEIETAVQKGYYAAGYLSYEVTYAFLNDSYTLKNNQLPLLWFGIFDEPITDIDQEIDNTSYHVGPWRMQQSKLEYEQAFAKIMTEIRAGKIEQVNYTVPFEAHFTGDTYHYYERLKKAQNASYSAFLHLGDIDILSASPELFFQQKGNQITVKPMKGTIHRGKSYQEDIVNRHWLQSSEKNQRENKLTIDSMKKELTKLTDPSSIYTPKLYEIEQFPTLYQMTSTINGTLLSGITIKDIIEELFPCSSISGVPKEETISLIHHIEPFPREVYCGAIGYITPNHQSVFNVPIRTVTIDRKRQCATYGAGGAITELSNVEEEYNEMVTKTKVLALNEQTFDLLETIGLVDGEYIILDAHLKRLQQSATYFQFSVPIESIKRKLHKIATKQPTGSWRIRLLLKKNGEVDITYKAMEMIREARVVLAQEPIDSANVFHYHKTTNRAIYDTHKSSSHNVMDVLLWNDKEELTEFTIGNIVIEIAGTLYTPPVHCGLLPGTYRDTLLKNGIIQEKVLLKSALDQASRIWLINSVRQWIEVYF